MKWLILDLSRAGDIDRQVDEVVTTFETLQKNRKSSNAQQVNKALQLLKKSIVERVADMEEFYHQNDLDPRSNRIEAARLKLKRLMKEVGFDANSVKSMGATTGPVGTQLHHHGAAATTPRGGGGMAASLSTRGIPGGASSASSSTAKPQPRVPTREDIEANNEKITLKIQMTHEEFEELRVRREAMKQLLHRGDGKMAWESAYKEPRADAAREGLYTTQSDLPYVGETNRVSERHQPSARGSQHQQRFNTYGKPRTTSPGRLHDGQTPYVSSNTTLASSKMRFDSPRDASRGGAKVINQQKSFSAVTPRTKANSSTLKIFPLGSMK